MVGHCHICKSKIGNCRHTRRGPYLGTRRDKGALWHLKLWIRAQREQGNPAAEIHLSAAEEALSVFEDMWHFAQSFSNDADGIISDLKEFTPHPDIEDKWTVTKNWYSEDPKKPVLRYYFNMGIQIQARLKVLGELVEMTKHLGVTSFEALPEIFRAFTPELAPETHPETWDFTDWKKPHD